MEGVRVVDLGIWRPVPPASVAGLDAPVDVVPGYGVYPTADGRVALGVIAEDHPWSATCSALGLDGDVAVLVAAGAPATPVRRPEEL